MEPASITERPDLFIPPGTVAFPGFSGVAVTLVTLLENRSVQSREKKRSVILVNGLIGLWPESEHLFLLMIVEVLSRARCV